VRGRAALLAAAPAAAALALALGGCGETPTATTRAPADATFEIGDAQTTPAVAPDCPGGRRPKLAGAAKLVRVADAEGRRGAAPAELAPARDLTVGCLRWTSWGESRAEGEGVARVLVCRPTCANGTQQRLAARVVLRGLRRCGSRRFYRRAEVRLAGRGGRPPTSYVRPPC
jgi:hypothetical protein